MAVTEAGGVAVCGPACGFLVGTFAGLVLDHLFQAADAENQVAQQEALMRKVLLDLDFQKGMRRLEELNRLRASKSKVSPADVRVLVLEARSLFLNASSAADYPLFSVRADCYVGSCNALMIQPDLQNYERAFNTCAQLETKYVLNPPGIALGRPAVSKLSCIGYNRRDMLATFKAAFTLRPKVSDAYDKPVELYEHMGPISDLLRGRNSRIPGLAPANQYTYDRYLGKWLDVQDRFCK